VPDTFRAFTASCARLLRDLRSTEPLPTGSEYRHNHSMAPKAPKSKKAKPKKRGRGRPAAGKDPLVGVRLPTERIKQIDVWAKREGAASRSEAIRRLVDQSLVAASQQPRSDSHKGASKATELASKELDRRVDHSLPAEERERRKRRLTKGPKEFREMRDDLPKQKG
jgi:Arc/MetJ-type ribon-helix-helix transcriptional regulator